MNGNKYDIKLSRSLNWNIASNISGLIAGARGSGKTFLLFSLIAMMTTLPLTDNALLGLSLIPTQIFAIDLKNADIGRLKHLLPKGRVATTKDEALKVLTTFVDLMKQRLNYIEHEKPFGATAKSLGMPAFYLVVDEWSATTAVFNNAMTKEDKLKKYQWFNTWQELMMLNRQALFGALIALQQATVVNSGLSSAIQEEVGLKVHMGSATSEAYRLTFGNDLKIPDDHLKSSEGMLWLEGQSSEWVTPFAAPEIKTDSFWSILNDALSNQSTSKYLKMCTN